MHVSSSPAKGSSSKALYHWHQGADGPTRVFAEGSVRKGGAHKFCKVVRSTQISSQGTYSWKFQRVG